MRLLFDQNLSPYLVRRLATDFPGSIHVRNLGLADATDRQVWERALIDDLTIVTKDGDYQTFAGPPPRWIWLRLAIAPPMTLIDSCASIGPRLKTSA